MQIELGEKLTNLIVLSRKLCAQKEKRTTVCRERAGKPDVPGSKVKLSGRRVYNTKSPPSIVEAMMSTIY